MARVSVGHSLSVVQRCGTVDFVRQFSIRDLQPYAADVRWHAAGDSCRSASGAVGLTLQRPCSAPGRRLTRIRGPQGSRRAGIFCTARSCHVASLWRAHPRSRKRLPATSGDYVGSRSMLLKVCERTAGRPPSLRVPRQLASWPVRVLSHASPLSCGRYTPQLPFRPRG